MISLYKKIDAILLNFFDKSGFIFAKISIFIIFFWFGLLKVVGESPANPIVKKLLENTLQFLSFDQFILYFGIFEMLIGIIFITPKCERLAIFLFVIHMITTFLPLILLPSITWQSFAIPTLEGQYIIKNLAIIALAINIASHLQKTTKKIPINENL